MLRHRDLLPILISFVRLSSATAITIVNFTLLESSRIDQQDHPPVFETECLFSPTLRRLDSATPILPTEIEAGSLGSDLPVMPVTTPPRWSTDSIIRPVTPVLATRASYIASGPAGIWASPAGTQTKSAKPGQKRATCRIPR